MCYNFSPRVFGSIFDMPFQACSVQKSKEENKPSVLRASGLLFILTTISALEISIVLLNQ